MVAKKETMADRGGTMVPRNIGDRGVTMVARRGTMVAREGQW